jgi:phage tail sheath protein FI
MMTRTFIRNDEIAYPWLAPAGVRRGLVDNAIQLGFIESMTGVFTPLSVSQALRDVMYINNVNPITFIPGTGITNFGNKTLQGTATALDRINVARLICYLRARLDQIGKQYLFEPNVAQTRNSISGTITSLLVDLVAKNGVYDYLVVCDDSNNTPTTIDQNQLWVDIAIEPVKAVEFIYIPVRIDATGMIARQAAA